MYTRGGEIFNGIRFSPISVARGDGKNDNNNKLRSGKKTGNKTGEKVKVCGRGDRECPVTVSNSETIHSSRCWRWAGVVEGTGREEGGKLAKCVGNVHARKHYYLVIYMLSKRVHTRAGGNRATRHLFRIV